MPSIDLRMSVSDYQTLCNIFKRSFRHGLCPETGAIGLLGKRDSGSRKEYILAALLTPGSGDLKVAENQQLVFDASYLRRAHLEMRSQKLAGIVMFHTHPAANTQVSFSPYDDSQEPLLVENLQELEPSTVMVSVVAGRSTLCGRWWASPDRVHALGNLIVVGESLNFIPLDGRAAPPAPPSAIFDRGLALTGAGALARLSSLRVAVIGASGTGSLFCELLARAGCRSILVLDDDIVKLINLNRILYATIEDVRQSTPKVDVLRRGIEGLGLGCEVDPVQGNILDRDVLARMRDADILIGCVDRALPRHLLCEFSQRYRLPYIDVGSEIGGDDRGIVSVDARASYMAPGRPCLQCIGVVTPRQLHFESLSAAEQARVRAQGYSDDLMISQPAVMDLNMRAASSGMMLVRHLLQPFLATPLPAMLLENVVTFSMKCVRDPKALNRQCTTCQMNPAAGYGDCGDSLGFDAETVAAVLSGQSAIPARD